MIQSPSKETCGRFLGRTPETGNTYPTFGKGESSTQHSKLPFQGPGKHRKVPPFRQLWLVLDLFSWDMLIFRKDNPLHFRLDFCTISGNTPRYDSTFEYINRTSQRRWQRKTCQAGEGWVSEQKRLKKTVENINAQYVEKKKFQQNNVCINICSKICIQKTIT